MQAARHVRCQMVHNIADGTMQMFEDAMPHFKLAARIQPHEVKWALMVASCLRRLGLQAEVSPFPSNLLHCDMLALQSSFDFVGNPTCQGL